MTDGSEESAGDAEGHADTDASSDGTDTDGTADGGLATRVADLERTVEALNETVERQQRDISYLAAAVDVEVVEGVCPDCGEGTLRTSSGLTWQQASCPECGLKRYL